MTPGIQPRIQSRILIQKSTPGLIHLKMKLDETNKPALMPRSSRNGGQWVVFGQPTDVLTYENGERGDEAEGWGKTV
jgi:hypothetical protein